jgi:hypothetical protein
MKRILVLLLCAILATEAQAASVDLSSMTNEEIQSLIDAAQEELNSRESEKVSLPVGDFFDLYEDSKPLQDLIRTQHIQELYDTVCEYIDSNNPGETDHAVKIKNIIEPVVAELDKYIVVRDRFKDANYVYYGDITEITDTVHFVPHADYGSDIGGTGFNITMGFYADNWLFFDKVNFLGNPYLNYQYSSEKIEDVVDGGIYEEKTFTYYTPECFENAFDKVDLSTIQFENSSRKETLEVELSDEEREAFEKIKVYVIMIEELFDMVSGYYVYGIE